MVITTVLSLLTRMVAVVPMIVTIATIAKMARSFVAVDTFITVGDLCRRCLLFFLAVMAVIDLSHDPGGPGPGSFVARWRPRY